MLASGMGLYICRELCERYGAEIAYQRSVLDQREGNEFFVLMPAAAGQRKPAQQQLGGVNSVSPSIQPQHKRPGAPLANIR
jgi:two-component system sensor histidine kinase PilS (NtrC family)